MDPCEPDLSWAFTSGIVEIGPEPRGMRVFLGEEDFKGVYIAHLVLRGTYLPGTVRCTAGGDRFRSPPYALPAGSAPTISVKCYADVQVNAYVLGSGPSTLTVLVWKEPYWSTLEQEVVEDMRSSLERAFIQGGDYGHYMRVPSGGITGREGVLFVGPPVDASAEAWEVFYTWDVQRQDDGTTVAVHPLRDNWRRYDDEY